MHEHEYGLKWTPDTGQHTDEIGVSPGEITGIQFFKSRLEKTDIPTSPYVDPIITKQFHTNNDYGMNHQNGLYGAAGKFYKDSHIQFRGPKSADLYQNKSLIDPTSHYLEPIADIQALGHTGLEDIFERIQPHPSCYETQYPSKIESIKGYLHSEPAEEPAIRGNELRLGSVDDALVTQFPDILDTIGLEQVVVPTEPGKIPRSLGRYCLVPVMHNRSGRSSQFPAMTFCKVPEGVKLNYGVEGEKPWLDAGLAVGLVYDGELSAVASACVTDDNRLKIVQLQGVTAKASSPDKKTRLRSGLHGGFQWRDTLVQTWIGIAKELGIDSIEIQGADNNRWLTSDKQQAFEQGYDQVAARMGFVRDETTGNWLMNLTDQKAHMSPDASISGS